MGIQYFTLTEGVLELHVDKLVIFDNAKKDRFSHLLITIGLLIYSVGFMYRGYKENDNVLLFIGIILALMEIFFLTKRKDELQRIDNEIFLKDITDVSFKDGKENTEVATIITGKNRRRKVIIEKTDNLPNRFKSNLKDLNINVSDV